jgi:hypothetical protein
MDVRLSCPLRVATVPWQPEPGCHALCLICKATYRLEPGTAQLDPVQLAPALNDRHWNDAESRSLYAPSDLVPVKLRAEVLLVGRAVSPTGRPVDSIRTRLCVGSVDKRLEVFGARFVTPEGKLVQESKILDVSLWYERAAGGPGTANPVGVKTNARDARGWRVLPSILPAGHRLRGPRDEIPPAGYGPIAASWPLRRSKIRSAATPFDPNGWWDEPLPRGLDLSYFNAAPADQQLGELPADVTIVLENLVARHPQLTTRLPGLRPRAMLKRRRGRRERVSMRADTLWIDSARAICTLIWRGRVELEQIDEPGRIEIVMEQERGDSVVVVVSEPDGAEPGRAAAARAPTVPGEDPDGGVTEPTFSEIELPPLPGTSWLRRPRARADEHTPVSMVLPAAIPPEPLPFRKSVPPHRDSVADARSAVPPGADSIAAFPCRSEKDGSITLDDGGLPAARPSTPLPFREAPRSAREAKPSSRDAPRSSTGEQTADDALPRRALPDDALPFRKSVPPARPTSPGVGPSSPAPLTAAELIPIEQCGAIAASLARRPDDMAAILDRSQLDSRRWPAIEAHWAAEIRKETRQGRTGLLRCYDQAYVERLEQERGPIEVEQYARLVVAAERGQAESTLRELGLPAGATVRIERVFLRRVVDRPALGDKVRKAVETARGQ